MSTGPRLPLALARAVAYRLMSHWRLVEPASMIVGGIRRESETVGDIDIIAPMPSPGEEDTLAETMRLCLDPAQAADQPALFAGTTPHQRVRTIGRVIKGLKPGFKCCDFELWQAPETPERRAELEAAGFTAENKYAVKVQLSRYTRGGGFEHAPSNRGWYEIRTTGDEEFGKNFLRAWKYLRGIGAESEGSKDNFLVDERGQVRSTPTEYHAFELIGCIWVPPRLRTGPEAILAAPGTRAWSVQSREKRARAMAHLGLATEREIEDRWNDDRLAAASTAWR